MTSINYASEVRRLRTHFRRHLMDAKARTLEHEVQCTGRRATPQWLKQRSAELDKHIESMLVPDGDDPVVDYISGRLAYLQLLIKASEESGMKDQTEALKLTCCELEDILGML